MHCVHVSFVQVCYMYIEGIGFTCALCASYVQLHVISVPACGDFVRSMYILHYTINRRINVPESEKAKLGTFYDV